jgi:asparaginyl-tRNA synthetase
MGSNPIISANLSAARDASVIYFDFRFMKEKIQNIRLVLQVTKSLRNFLEEEGFVEIFPPTIVRASGACESINTMFYVAKDRNLSWFRPQKPHRAHLLQTAQFDLEAVVPSFKKVFSIGPTFRAEDGDVKRYLIEFTMAEIEFIGGLNELLVYIEKIILRIIRDILRLPGKTQKDLGLKNKDIRRLKKIKPNFPKIMYSEAIKALNLEFGKDISSKDEQRLVKRFGNQPVLLTHHPNSLWNHRKDIEVIKFFNMVPDPKDPSQLLSVDLILPIGGEALGGAQRLEKFGDFKSRLVRSKMFKLLQQKGGGLEDFEWYLKIFKKMKTMPIHSGGGFGVARILKFLRGEDDIRKVTPFPSSRGKIS